MEKIIASMAIIGYGIALHDCAHQVWQLKGYHNPIEGVYVGFALMLPYLTKPVYGCVKYIKSFGSVLWSRWMEALGRAVKEALNTT